MLHRLKEYRKYVEITGFRSLHICEPRELSGTISHRLPSNCEIQFFDADIVATWQHLYFATVNALMARRNHCNLSKSLAVEIVLYASAQRQIKKALDRIGLKQNSENVAVVIVCPAKKSADAGLETTAKFLKSNPDDSVLELTHAKTQRICEVFDIKQEELEAISARGDPDKALIDLVMERVALLSTKI